MCEHNSAEPGPPKYARTGYFVRGALREAPRAGKRYPRLKQARREEARPIGRASSYMLPCYSLHEQRALFQTKRSIDIVGLLIMFLIHYNIIH